jgi:hypothetical protein
MLKALIRTGVTAGFMYGVYSIARKFWGSEIDNAIDTAKSKVVETAKAQFKNVNHEVGKHGKELTASMQDLSRKAM